MTSEIETGQKRKGDDQTMRKNVMHLQQRVLDEVVPLERRSKTGDIKLGRKAKMKVSKKGPHILLVLYQHAKCR